ncbi:MAG: hypothetical protein RI580_14365, partial [Halothece sp. Uz-M2-17]|nr:hypothetical protein [Halothece sp. Uz-M2-17]
PEFQSLTTTKSRIWLMLNYANKGFSQEDQALLNRKISNQFSVISQFSFSGINIILVENN